MLSKNLPDETKAYGAFLCNFLNCIIKPEDMSALVEECLNIMKQYLGYKNPKWNQVQITGSNTFNELVAKTEMGYFKKVIAPLFRAYALG